MGKRLIERTAIVRRSIESDRACAQTHNKIKVALNRTPNIRVLVSHIVRATECLSEIDVVIGPKPPLKDGHAPLGHQFWSRVMAPHAVDSVVLITQRRCNPLMIPTDVVVYGVNDQWVEVRKPPYVVQRPQPLINTEPVV
ncbi:MAG: hypothetical protein QM695_07535 [Micropruina sp.]